MVQHSAVGQAILVVVVVHQERLAQLVEVGHADHAMGVFVKLSHRGHQQARQHDRYRNDDHQFDEAETGFGGCPNPCGNPCDMPARMAASHGRARHRDV